MTRGLFAELRRRNVLRAAVLYIGAVWALTQGIAQLTPVVGAPEWAARWFLVAAIIGFPLWIAFAWFFEFTPEGLKRESDVEPHDSIARHTGRKLDFAIIGVLALAVVLLLTDRFVLHRGVNEDAAIPVAEYSIAVLPFVNRSSDKEQEYFSDGIAEDLLNLLSRIPELQVTARTSSFSFKGKTVSIREIGRQLRVAHILEGSVQKAGNAVRITAQLIDAASEKQRWSQTWDRQLDDIFKVQDEIAATVVGELRIKLLAATPKSKPVDPTVYPLILQAQALTDGFTKDGMAEAIKLLEHALAVSPNEARAWALLARVRQNQTLAGFLPAVEGNRMAQEAATRALDLDPQNALAIALLGRIASDFENDLVTAARQYQRAIALEPGNLNILNGCAILLSNLGRLDEALALLEYRASHDPANPIAHLNLGSVQITARRWDAAAESLRTALRLSPDLVSAHTNLSAVLLLGKHDAAGALAELEKEPDEATRMGYLPLVLDALGRNSDADVAEAKLIEQYGQTTPFNVAIMLAHRRKPDDAFEWLEKARQGRDQALPQVLTEPLLDPLHDDPRWLPFLRKIGYAPEQLAKIEFKVTLPKAIAAEQTNGVHQ